MAKKETTAVAERESTEISADMAADFMQDASQGFENVTSKDVAIPYYGILQALSPQVKRGPQQVEGAQEGDLINTVTNEIIPGETGIWVICCAFEKMYVEWVLREKGGGLVKQHKTDEILKTCKPDEKGRPLTPDGHNIVDTAYHYIIRVKEGGGFERALISMTSTQLKKSRRWIAQMMNLQIPVGGKMINPPMFSHMYHLTTIGEEKNGHSWFGWAINKPTLLTDHALYAKAREFSADVRKGMIETPPPPMDNEEESFSNTGTSAPSSPMRRGPSEAF